MSDRGLIYDWYPNEDSPVVNITQVGYTLQFSSDDDPNNYPIVPLASVPAVLQAVQSATVTVNGVPIAALPLIQNIPSELPTLWSSQLTSAQTNLTSQLNSALGQGNFTASAITSPAGLTRARVVPGGPLLLDFWVSGLSLDLTNVTILNHRGLSFHVTFDAEVLLVVFIQWPFVQVIPAVCLFNANIAPTGKTKTELQLAQTWWQLGNLNTSGTYGYQLASPYDLSGYENQINTAVLPPPSSDVLSPITNAFAAIAAAVRGFGFGAFQPPPAPGVQPCTPVANPAAPSSLMFQLAKPIDPPPVAYNPLTQAGPGLPITPSNSPYFAPNWILGGPTISVSQTQVSAGGSYTVRGTGFPQSDVGEVGWSNTCSGALISSDIEWQVNGQPQTHATVRQPSPLFFVAPRTPQPGDTFQFQVRNRDALTTTAWSDPITVQALGNVQLVLSYLRQGLKSPLGGGGGAPFQTTEAVGTAVVGVAGLFSQPLTIPGNALPCIATLSAEILGQQVAVTQLNIVLTVQAVIRVINPVNGLAVNPPAATQASVTAVQGEGFLPSTPAGPPTTVTLYIDQATGPGVATAVVGADGTFTASFVCPITILPGNHSLIAVEAGSPQTIQTTLQLAIQEIPH